jgi:hypothetical protein
MITYQPSNPTQNEFINVYQHGGRYRLIANVVGSILVVREIRKSRKKLSTHSRPLKLNSSEEPIQTVSSRKLEPSFSSNLVEPISLSTKLEHFSIDSQLQCTQDLWKQARVFETLTSQERSNS